MNTEQYNNCVKIYADGLFRFIVKNLRDDYEAENVVQNTFEKLWIRHKDVDYEKAKAYLFTSAYNNMIDTIRKNKRLVELEVAKEPALAANEYTGVTEILNKLVNKLPEKQRSAILLRDYEGYSYDEIAEITGQTAAQVKVNIFRARVTLKKQLGSMEAMI